MNFTREPIIETVIMPREGCKLLVRNSKGSGQEEYYVDSIEVVSFGHSFFFRSQERPKSFLVPVSDYEILEMKEIRIPLKNVSSEHSIKIGARRVGAPRTPRDGSSDVESYELPEREPLERPTSDRKRGKRRRNRRGGRPESSVREMHESSFQEPVAAEESSEKGSFESLEQGEPMREEPKAPSFISKLFPPPPILIKDSLSRYKTAEAEEDEVIFPKEDKYEETLFDPLPPEEEPEQEEEPPLDQ